MNSDVQQYDVIVLGFDETAQETVNQLQEQGKRALYIPVDPQMMMTLMSQKQSSIPITKSVRAINVHQHHVETPLNETITYFFQPEVLTEMSTEATESNQIDLVTPEEEHLVALQNDEVEDEQVVFTLEETDKSDELETPLELDERDSESFAESLTEKVELGNSLPVITPLAQESSLIDNRLLGIRESSTYRERLSKNGKNAESMISSYHLFNPIRIEEDESEIASEKVEDPIETPTMANTPEEHLEVSHKSMSMIDSLEDLSLESDIDEEVDVPNPLFEQEAEESAEEVKEESADHQPFLLDRDLRLRKKLSFNNHHQGSKTSTVEPLKIEKTRQTKTEVEPPKTPDIFPLEPFSSRRRNKKNRLFSSLENTLPNPIVQPTPAPTPYEATTENVSSLIQDSITQEEDLTDTESKEIVTENEHNSADNLKIDTIEFEEPYGYNSFEDIFPSSSNSTDRKRQELDKIEKRKIALRGLHNLINNLG